MYKKIILACLFLYTSIKADLIVSAGEGVKGSLPSYEIAFNTGPGWYRSQSGIITHQNTGSFLTTFKTTFDPLCALVLECTARPHKNSFININIGGGLLPKGNSTFKYTDCTSYQPIGFERHRYKAHFFNANASMGFLKSIGNNWELEAGLGYSYDYGALFIANNTKVDYYTVGPILSIGFNGSFNKYDLNITYSFIPGFYQERESNRATQSISLLSFPLSTTNHLDIVGQYQISNHCSCGLTFSLDFFKSYKKGAGTQVCPQDSSEYYTYLYDILDTFILVGFIALSF